MYKKELIFPSLLAIFCVISNFVWLKIDTVPQAWDESLHLTAASAFADIIKHEPLKAIGSFVTQESYYPPLVPFIAAFFGLNCPDMDSFTRSMAIFHILLIFSVFAYTRRRFDFPSACAASALTMAFPLIYAQGHLMMLDLPLTALVMFTIYLLCLPELFKQKRLLFLLGFIAGCALLVKWTYWIYVLAPFAIRLIEEKKQGLSMKGLWIVSGIILITAGPWYLYNSVSIITKLLMYSFDRGRVEGLPSVFSIPSLVYYFQMLPDLLNPVLAIICLAGTAFIVINKEWKYADVLLYFIIPVVFMTLLQNKKDRYLMPALPFAAIAGSYLVFMVKGRAKAVSAGISAVSILAYSFAVFPMNFPWMNTARPQKADWKITQILDQAKTPGVFVIVPDAPQMNNINYGFYIKNFYKNLKTSGIFNFPMFTDYFLIKTGDQGPAFSAADKRQQITMDVLANKGAGAGLFEKIYETPLPDGSTAKLYKRKQAIRVDSGSFESSLNAGAMGMLGLYLKGAKKFRFATEVQEGTALVKSLRVSFSEGLAGDFKHKDAGLKIRNADIEIKGLLLNPEELIRGNLSILSMDGIYLHSMEVSEADLTQFAAIYAKKAKDLKVKIDNGNITFEAVYSGTKMKAVVKLYNPSKENPDIAVKVISLRAGPIGIPAVLANFLIRDYNPLLNRSKSPVKLYYNDILAQGGVLRIY